MEGGKLTRTGAATRIGCSVATVRRLEGRELRPEIGPDRVRLFDPAEVEKLAASWRGRGRRRGRKARAPEVVDPLGDGALAAEVFAAFDHGADAAEAVIRYRIAPTAARALRESWAQLHALHTAEPAARLDKAEDKIGSLSARVDELESCLSAMQGEAKSRSRAPCPCGGKARRIVFYGCACGWRGERLE